MILSRCTDFITTKLINNWREKKLDDETLTENELRNIFKIPKIDLFDVNEKDIINRLINRETIFNCQHHHLYPNGQDRPEWAKED